MRPKGVAMRNSAIANAEFGVRMSVHPKNTSLGEVRLAGGSHARDRRESQFGMKKTAS